jgi:hypothetical protein
VPAGKWVLRYYVGTQAYELETIAEADDTSNADGVKILTFQQAQAEARARQEGRTQNGAGELGPYLVNDALDDYVKWLESEGRSKDAIADATYRATAFIRPKLGDKEVAALTAKDFRHWRDGVAKALPRIRTKPGDKQKYRPIDEEANDEEREDEQRKRRATVNRTSAGCAQQGFRKRQGGHRRRLAKGQALQGHEQGPCALP